MRLLIVSEGKHELGAGDVAGALETFVRRLVRVPVTCDTRRVSDPTFRGRFHGRGDGYFKKALGCVLQAVREGYDGIVLVIDQDDQPERRRQLGDAQAHLSLTTLPRAMGVAVITFDAWMLADERALSAVLGHVVQRQPDPETTPDAKDACTALRDDAGCGLSLSELYARIAGSANLDLLMRRCPAGFAPFAERTRRITDPNRS